VGREVVLDILAKGGIDGDSETLEDHTLKCIKVAAKILNDLPEGVSDERIRRELVLALAFHDTGKAAIGFQEYLRGKRKNWNHWRHEILSASFASIYDQPEEVVFAVLTHHCQIPPVPGLPTKNRTLNLDEIPLDSRNLTPVWREMKREWEQNQEDFIRVWSKIATEVGLGEVDGGYSLPCLGLARNWLDSSKEGQRRISLERRMFASKLRGLLITSDHIASAHRVPPGAIRLRDFTINIDARAYQKKAASANGSLVLRAPTGSGKTEAALLWAQSNQARNARLFYVLPNIASINAMRKRLSEIFGYNNVGLLHSRAAASLYHLMEDKDGASKFERQANAKALAQLAREMYYPVRVSTPHQILRSTLRGKGWETMLSDMPKACFIFDEVHAYEPRIVGLVLGSVRLLTDWGARSCFMSATLPSFLKKLIERATPATLIEPDRGEASDRAVMEKKRHSLDTPLKGTILDNLQKIEDCLAQANSTLIVCNTIPSAQEVYRRISCPDKLLLHSRFNQNDRLRIESMLSNSRLPKVVISTQAIEVSLNVDFEQAFIEPAPIDALIQRMGRVNRSGMRPPARVTLLERELSKHSVYTNQNRIKEGIDALMASSNPLTEENLVAIADSVYRSGYSQDEMEQFESGFNHPDLVHLGDRLIAGTSKDWIEETIENADRSIDLLPYSLRNKYETLRSNGLWIEANNLLVPVNVQSVAGLVRTGLVDTSSDPWVTLCHYSSNLGLMLEQDAFSAII
jgi:CRISPR-associated endonuclease/helicase Cas3